MAIYSISPTRLSLLRPVFNRFKISSPLGDRILDGKPDFHPGIDFACPVGSIIKAVHDGVILRAGYENESDHLQGFGLRVWQEIKIDDDTFYIWYGHMSSLMVKNTATVLRGEILGLSGNSGHVSPKPTPANPQAGAHLHVQIRKKDTNMLYNADWLDA